MQNSQTNTTTEQRVAYRIVIVVLPCHRKYNCKHKPAKYTMLANLWIYCSIIGDHLMLMFSLLAATKAVVDNFRRCWCDIQCNFLDRVTKIYLNKCNLCCARDNLNRNCENNIRLSAIRRFVRLYVTAVCLFCMCMCFVVNLSMYIVYFRYVGLTEQSLH